MAMTFWIASGITVGMASVLGLGLGTYAVTPQKSSLSNDMGIDLPSSDTGVLIAVDQGVDYASDEIQCRGCGPTLADRQRVVDMAGFDPDGVIDDGRDRVVVDYMAKELPSPVYEPSSSIPSDPRPATFGPIATDPATPLITPPSLPAITTMTSMKVP